MTNLDSNCSLSVSCVYYDTDTNIFEQTLTSIAAALSFAKQCNVLKYYEVHLINNNSEKENLFLQSVEKYRGELVNVIIHNGHGNIGYGKANNLAISQTQCKYHLILNPDIITDVDAITSGIGYLENHSETILVTPSATNLEGEIEYLPKRMPSFLVIFLRGLGSQYLNKIFQKKIDLYAYKDKIPTIKPFEIELASGCFMLCQSHALKKVGGFSKDYFLYFEDFDLSKKMSQRGKLLHLPQMKVKHLGGYAARKGRKHIKLFLTSYFIFRMHSQK